MTSLPEIQALLADGPLDLSEVGLSVADARALEDGGVIAIDPDRFPDSFVPGNPMIVRLPGDERRWPGWARWNI